MKISVRTTLLFAAIIVLLAIDGACYFKEGKEHGERAVERFHNQYNSEQFSEIYRQADEEFRKTGKEEDFIASIRALRQKLGTVKLSSQNRWSVNTTPVGTMITLFYDTEFIEGHATEQFVFRVSDGKALLYNYNIDVPRYSYLQLSVVKVRFTTETQRTRRMHRGLDVIQSSVPPPCPLCLCGEL